MSKHEQNETRLLTGVGASFLFLAICMLARGNEICYRPNPNMVLCASIPPDATLDCGTILITDCANRKEYDIKNFPDGIVEHTTGTVAQQQANCIRSRLCVNPGSGSFCAAGTIWGAYSLAAKWVSGAAQCPEEDP